MVTIITSNGSLKWELGAEHPLHDHQIDTVREVIADNAELEHIRDLYNNKLPIPVTSPVHFYGDTAKQIASCL